MPSIHRRPGSKFFSAAFTDAKGIRRFRSTRETGRPAAQKIAASWEEMARKTKTREQFNRVANELHQQLFGETSAACSLRDYSIRWLASCERENALATYSNYKSAVKKFLAFMDARGKAGADLREISLSHLVAFRDELAGRLSGRRTNNVLKIVGVMLRRAWRENLMPEDILSKVRSVRQERAIRRDLSSDEIRAVLENASDEWKGLVACGLYSGLRLGDIVRLRWANVDLVRGEIRVVAGKTDAPLVLPVAEPLRRFFEALPSSDDPQAHIFPRAAGVVEKNKGRVAVLSGEFHEMLATAGIVDPRVEDHKAHKKGRTGRRERNPVSFHSLRHSFVSLLKNAGAPQLVAEALAGHSSAAISRMYSHAGDENARRAVGALPDVLAPRAKLK